MSSEYNPDNMEDELAKSIEQIINDETERAQGYSVEPEKEKTEATPPPVLTEEPKKDNKKLYIIAGVAAAIIAIIVIIVVVSTTGSKKNSFDYQYDQGVTYLEEKDYDQAVTCFKKAIELEQADKDVNVRLSLAEAYEGLENYEEAINSLYSIFAFDEFNVKAIAGVCELLYKDNDIEGLNEFIEKYMGTDGEEGLSDYIVTAPKSSEEPGEYTGEKSIELTSDEDTVIYYTTNGKEPDEDSEVYSEKITLEKGESTIKAFAVNEDGVKSAVSTFDYEIVIDKPASAQVTPAGGSYEEAQKITVTVPSGSKAYYTFDKTNPTESSEEYKEPIDMPEGDTEFRVIIVDKYGQASDVKRISYSLNIPNKYSYDDAREVLEGRLKELSILIGSNGTPDGGTLTLVYYSKRTINERDIYLVSVDIKKDGNTERQEYWYGIDADNCETFTVTSPANDGNYELAPL